MSYWRAMSPTSQLYRSQETLEKEDIIGSDLPPQSPVFDFEDFLIDPTTTTTHHMASSSHLSTMDNLDNPHLWANWDSTQQSHQEHSINPFISSFSNPAMASGHQGSPALSPYRASPLSQQTSYKLHEAMNTSPQSIMNNIYTPQQSQIASFNNLTQPNPYQTSSGGGGGGASGSFSDYELALSATGVSHDNDVDMFTHPTKLDPHQQQYHGFRRTPYGDSVHGNGHNDPYPAYRHDSINHSVLQSVPSAGRVDQQHQQQRRYIIPRRDSSVPPYANVNEYLSARSNANVFAASAPNSSTFSHPSSFSPSSSPRSIDGSGSVARSSPSLPPASPQLFTPGSPGEQFAAPPSQFSASPHLFTSVSPTFTSASPITFVHQTNQYTSGVTTASYDDARHSSSQESTDPEDNRMRKRKRILLTDAEDDSDEKHSDGMWDLPSLSQEPRFGFCHLPN